MGQLQGGGDVELNQFGDGAFFMLLQQAEVIDPGGIDQRIDAAKALRRRQHVFTSAGLTNIGGYDGHVAAVRLGQRLQSGALTADQEQLRPFGEQGADQRLANPATGPGDDGAAFRNFHRVSSDTHVLRGRLRNISPYRR